MHYSIQGAFFANFKSDGANQTLQKSHQRQIILKSLCQAQNQSRGDKREISFS